jgi:hypothetical protein
MVIASPIQAWGAPAALLFEPNSSAGTSNAKGTSIPHDRLLLASLASSTGDVAPTEVLSSHGIGVEADLAQLLAKFVALVVLIKLEEGIEGGTRGRPSTDFASRSKIVAASRFLLSSGSRPVSALASVLHVSQSVGASFKWSAHGCH